MEQSGHDGLLVKLQLRKNNGHTERMNNISLAGFAHLSLVGIVRDPEGFLDHGYIIRRVIFAHTTDQLLVKDLGADKIVHFSDVLGSRHHFLF